MNERDTALSQALSAYAGVTSGQLLDARLVRARILRSARAPRRRPMRLLSLVLPLAATFAASAAFAASQPAVRAAITARWHAVLGTAPAVPNGGPSSRFSAHTEPIATPNPQLPNPNDRSSRDALAPIAVDELPLAPTAQTIEAARSAGRAWTEEDTAQSETEPQLEAYRNAHRTHFDSGDARKALATWDRYLADFPSGAFVDDARFNRALCLIRVGRIAEAQHALAPFAESPRGTYRQTEAASLLRGLSAK
jgi:hypothetical protein